jgi:hypothetical protein
MFEDIFDFEIESGVPFLFAAIGGGIAYFTASGGFATYAPGLEPSMFMKIASGVAGAVVGFIWGSYQSR